MAKFVESPFTQGSYLIETDHGVVEVSEHDRAAFMINELANSIYKGNVERGWWDKPREDGTLIALMHSELSEAMEGSRKNLMDDHLPHREMTEVELADCMIRILDFAGAKRYDIGGALREKLAYNAMRPDHKRENRALDDGKKY